MIFCLFSSNYSLLGVIVIILAIMLLSANDLKVCLAIPILPNKNRPERINNQLLFSKTSELAEEKTEIKAENYWNESFQQLSIPIAIISQKGSIIKSNFAFNSFFRILSDETLKSFNFRKHDNRDSESCQELEFMLKTKASFTMQSSWHINSSFHHFKETYKPIPSGDFIVTIEDETEIKKAQRTAEIIEEKYNQLIEQLPVGIYRALITGEIVFVNNYLAKLLGYKSASEITGCASDEIFNYPTDYTVQKNKAIEEKKNRYVFEFLVTGKNKQAMWLKETATIFYDTSDEPLLFDCIIEDITQKKLADLEVNRLYTAINQLSEGVIITDAEGTILYTNHSVEKMSQYAAKELVGKKMNIFKSEQQSEDFYTDLWKTIKSGKSWEGQIANRQKNGGLYIEYMLICPVKNENNEIENYIAIKKDISEKLKLEEQLRHSHNLQAIGTLTGGIAHDFNNILMGMQIYTEVLLKKLDEKSQEHHLVSQIFNAEKRAKGLINQILTFSRSSIEEIKPLQPHIIVKEATKLIQATYGSRIRIEHHIEDCGFINASPTHIFQIVMNLCTNAVQALDENGLIVTRLNLVSQIDHLDGSIKHPGSSWICLSIKDNGNGIDDSIKDFIFEPFYTTRIQGTGLGLSNVRDIVNSYEGEIFFDSEKGAGTTFYVYLPVK
jgi:PAS domain S-box-containing protein